MSTLSNEQKALAQSLAELSPAKISQVMATANTLKRSVAEKKKNSLDPKVRKDLIKRLKAATKIKKVKLPFTISGYVEVNLGWTEDWEYGSGNFETHVRSCKSKVLDREEARDLIGTHFGDRYNEPHALQKEIDTGRQKLTAIWEEIQSVAAELRMDPGYLAELLVKEADVESAYDYF